MAVFNQEAGQDCIIEKSELDRYLGEEREVFVEGEPFNVLEWWKKNSSRYPILALMAKDALAIPISTVASESAFSTGGRVLDVFRSSLTPTMVEALICGQDWLKASTFLKNYEEDFQELEEIEKGLYIFLNSTLCFLLISVFLYLSINTFILFFVRRRLS